MRLIDADELMAKVKAIRYMRKIKAQSLIDECKTAELIRCKDCKHYYKREWLVGGGSYTTCWNNSIALAKEDDYCSRAERKEE